MSPLAHANGGRGGRRPRRARSVLRQCLSEAFIRNQAAGLLKVGHRLDTFYPFAAYRFWARSYPLNRDADDPMTMAEKTMVTKEHKHFCISVARIGGGRIVLESKSMITCVFRWGGDR